MLKIKNNGHMTASQTTGIFSEGTEDAADNYFCANKMVYKKKGRNPTVIFYSSGVLLNYLFVFCGFDWEKQARKEALTQQTQTQIFAKAGIFSATIAGVLRNFWISVGDL